MRRLLFLAVILAASCSLLSAEFTYQQTTQMTGGALFEMMKMAGPFAKQAREPNVSTVIVKGNRMATVRKDQVSVVDLDKDTITEIDMAKKQYSVMTFAQMKDAMEKMLAQAQARQKDKAPQQTSAELNYKVSAKATGQTKTINGISAREVVMEMVTEVTDKEKGASGSMNISIDNWLGTVPGYAEVQAFHRKMGEKMGYAFGSGMAQMAAMRPEALKGLEQAGKEMAKVDGFPVQSIMKMGGTGEGADLSAAQQQQQQQPARQQQQPQAGATASDAAVGAALGRLGIGGFGRNRNKQQQPQQPPPQGDAPPATAAPGAPTSASASLMEMTTELSSFSPTADGSKFDVPTGFKQVENEMIRRAR